MRIILAATCVVIASLAYMAEVDSACPDLALRARYRAELVGHDSTL